MQITKKLSAMVLAVVLLIAAPFELQAAMVATTENESIVSIQEETGSGSGDATVLEDNLKYAATSSAGKIYFPTELKVHTGVSSEIHSYVYYVWNLPSTGKITKVSISNKKIATIEKRGNDSVSIRPVKAGNATVKVTVKYGSTTKTLTSRLTVYKYTNPLKSYKIAGKEIKTKFNKTSMIRSYTFKKNQTVTCKVTPKSGWTVGSFSYYYGNGKSKRYSGNSPKIKMAGNGSIQINMVNNKTGLIENIVLNVVVK